MFLFEIKYLAIEFHAIDNLVLSCIICFLSLSLKYKQSRRLKYYFIHVFTCLGIDYIIYLIS